MICKITAVNAKKGALNDLKPKNINSSQSLSNYQIPNLLKTKLKQIKEQPSDKDKKKIDLEIVMVSEEFFDYLPRVQRCSISSRKEKLAENKNNEAWS